MSKALVSFRLSPAQVERLGKLHPSFSLSDSVRLFLRASPSTTERRSRPGDRSVRVTVRLDAADAALARSLDMGSAIDAAWADDL